MSDEKELIFEKVELVQEYENIKRYKLASSEGINKVGNRMIRFEILKRTCLNEDKKDEVLSGLNSAKGVIFSYLKKSLKVRYIPNLTFHYDKTLIETNKVLTNIRNLNINDNED